VVREAVIKCTGMRPHSKKMSDDSSLDLDLVFVLLTSVVVDLS
jgi:hypothetical protein